MAAVVMDRDVVKPNYSTSRGEHYAKLVELGSRGRTNEEEQYRR